MAFTDRELADAMSQLLVDSKVMTASQRDELLDNPTEIEVSRLLGSPEKHAFEAYWEALGSWMSVNGGNLTLTTGTNVPGRSGGKPSGVGSRAIYNDAFRDTGAFITTDSFSLVKGISNQLRFVSVMSD